MRSFLFLCGLIAAVHACCYTLGGGAGETLPVFTWTLDTGGSPAVAPPTMPGPSFALRSLDNPTTPLGQCFITEAAYHRLGVWLPFSLDAARHIFSFTTARFDLGPYVRASPNAPLLLNSLNGSPVRLGLQCGDSALSSCVEFVIKIVRAREGTVSSLAVSSMDNPSVSMCVRTEAPSATPTQTPSSSPSPSLVPRALQGRRVQFSFESGELAVMRFGFDYAELSESHGEHGAQFCSLVVTSATGDVLATLVPATHATRTRGNKHQLYHAYQVEQSRLDITVVWSNGGWCRVAVTVDGTVTLVGCRLFVGTALLERIANSLVMVDDAQCDAPLPLQCNGDLEAFENNLCTFRSDAKYVEAQLARVSCTDGATRSRFVAAAGLSQYGTPIHCVVVNAGLEVMCDDLRVLRVLNTTTLQAECPEMDVVDMETVRACVPRYFSLLGEK